METHSKTKQEIKLEQVKEFLDSGKELNELKANYLFDVKIGNLTQLIYQITEFKCSHRIQFYGTTEIKIYKKD